MKVHFNLPSETVFSKRLQEKQGSGEDFGTHLKKALQDVNILQHESDIAFQRLIDGEIEFHEAMITAEKANLALQLTMAIRTKLLEAYQEIMRMQV
ncbi:MAG: flagellar hook-basal body complex protein FliE [Firmicutes bacterium]|nr:flagellar hook-basal body complex protein FliE [Bacillota bacterium]